MILYINLIGTYNHFWYRAVFSNSYSLTTLNSSTMHFTTYSTNFKRIN